MLRVLFCLTLLAVIGCDSKPPTVVQKFKNAQSSTITPHGKIDISSVQETADGRIQYKTTDGSTWTVAADKAADGQLRYGEPEKAVEPQ